jgi:NADPH2:quinone reductase
MRTPKVVRRHALAARDLMIAGRVTIDVADVRPLAEAADVHRRLEGGGTHGKLLLAARDAA